MRRRGCCHGLTAARSQVEVLSGYVAVGVANSKLQVTGGATAAYDDSKSGGWMYNNSGDKFHAGQSSPCGAPFGPAKEDEEGGDR